MDIERIIKKIPSKGVYLELIKEGASELREQYPSLIESWKKEYIPSVMEGYSNPRIPIKLIRAESFLYNVTKEKKYAERVRNILVNYGEFTKIFNPKYKKLRVDYKRGIPPITNFFDVIPYMQAYDYIKDSGAVSRQDKKKIEYIISSCMENTYLFHEWGPMNRAILMAVSLAYGSKILSSHSHSKQWMKLADRIADSSWGKWTIEDTQVYNPIWLEGLMLFGEITGKDGLYREPATKYYLDYFVQLLCPAGTIADFGDAHDLFSCWQIYVNCLEKGAREYKDGEMKFAAASILKTALEHLKNKNEWMELINAYRWADDNVSSVMPEDSSREVLDDLVGKKIVFRSGWKEKDTYLLLNYRDEGAYGIVSRNYLRKTIPVEGEKMHHGHADENSICLLMSNGEILLHDSGYGETHTNRIYGADMFHNRIVARSSLAVKGQKLLEFLRDEPILRVSKGSAYKPVHFYRPVSTDKLHFYSFEEVDYSRTRLFEPERGYQWDRIISYLKKDDIFVIFDTIEIKKENDFCFSNLFYTQKILNWGDNWFDTIIDKAGSWENKGDMSLLILFPENKNKIAGLDEIRRAFELEKCLYQTTSQHLKSGSRINFTTVLIPHKREKDTKNLVSGIDVIKTDKGDKGLGVVIKQGKETTFVCCRADLSMEEVEENVRPKYKYNCGKIKYGNIETDARYCYIRANGKSLNYAFAEATGLFYKKRELFTSPVSSGYSLQPDGAWCRTGVSKWEAWENNIKV